MVFPENENSNSAEEKKSLNEDFHNETALDENLDDSKAKFLGNGNNDLHHDPHVVIELGSDIAFTGLGKEELMKYAEDPFWIRTRMILFIIFWVGWLAMLVAAILIIVFAPKCPERPDMKWYQTDIVYQINPKSFKDTSAKDVEGAGIGDLNGIASKVGYLQGLDINALYISAFYEAGESSYDGNDVVDHMKVDPIFGTMADFDALRKATKKKGMKIIVDFIPNHTGTKHDWFNKSRDRVGMDESSTAAIDYSDFYIWANSSGTDGAGNPIPPNNWVTVYGQPAWKYDSVRKQFYYFAYLPEYPDLNLRNSDVLNQLDGVLRFWLDKGVDGFVIQGLQQLVEHDNLGDNETSPGSYTRDHEENMKIMARWRGIINSYSEKPGRERVLIGLVSGGGNLTEQYQQAGVHIVITEALAKIDPDTCNNECIEESLKQAKPNGAWMGWMLDDGNTERFGSRVSEEMQRAFQALTMLLPGTPIVYYGDEIGMTNGNVDPAQAKDPLAKLGSMPRDNYRTPMLWTGGENAGFCAVNVTSWLPVNADYDKSSVEHRSAHNNGYSLLESFADLAKLRQKESIQFGSLSVETHKDKLLLITRKAPGFPSYLVAINLGQDSLGPLGLADKMTVVYDSQGENVGKEFQTKDTPIAFQHRGDVMIFEF